MKTDSSPRAGCVRQPLLAGVVVLAAACAPAAAQTNVIELTFNLGVGPSLQDRVYIELFDDRPLSRDNFLQYVDAGLYDGTIFHRLVPGFVLQGGGFYPAFLSEPPPVNVSLDPSATVDLDGDPSTGNPTVDNEFDNDPFRSNLTGTIAYAKTAAGPDSATNQWFFNLDDNSANLDNQNGGFTVFAQVVGNGMDVVLAYQSEEQSGVGVTNLNPDVDNDGVRDGGPFAGNFGEPTTPFFFDEESGFNELLTLLQADRVRYFGDGSLTNVPNGGLTISGQDGFIDQGAQFTGPGRIIVQTGSTLRAASDLALSQLVLNLGVLSPGNRIGQLSAPAFQQSASGEVLIEIAAADQFDSLLFTSGTTLLDGKLTVDLLDGYTPAVGDSYTVLQADFIVGSFNELDLPALPDGLAWDANQTSSAVELTVTRAGDYNGDGVVTIADYQVWEANFGASGFGLPGDGNLDGVVGAADYPIWRDALGVPAVPAEAAATPEAGSLAAALVACCLTAGRRRCRT